MNKKMTQNVSKASADGEVDILEMLMYVKSKLGFLLIFLLTATDGLTCLLADAANMGTKFVNFLKSLKRAAKRANHETESIQDALNTFDRNAETPLQKTFVFNMCGCFAGASYGSYPCYYSFHKNINQ